MASKDFKVKNGIDIQSPLPVSMGGTGQTSSNNTLNALLPTQSGNENKILSTDGSNTSWVAQSVAYQRGGTSSRPGSPSVGDLYYNTDYNYFESYTANGWFPIAAAPGIPSEVSATNQGSGRAYNNGQASVSFTANTSGGAPSSFIVTPSPSTSPSTFTGSSSPITVTNLASSTQYTYTVQATSPYGTSSASSPSTGVTATTVPQAPTINSATAGDSNAVIAFTAGATGGSSITSYSIVSSPATTTQTTSSSPYTFTGLTNGTAYTFTITATNANGTSLASSASSSVTPAAAITGSYEAIASYTVPSGGTSTIIFNGIPQGYSHLQIRATTQGSRTSGNDSQYYMQLGYNTIDTGSNYYDHSFFGQAKTSNATYSGANNGGGTSIMPPNNSGTQSAGNFGAQIWDIYDYNNANKYKTVKCFYGEEPMGLANGYGGSVGIGSGLWYSKNPINTIQFTMSGYNFNQYSRFDLYGVK